MFLVNDNDLFGPLLTLSLPGSVVLSQRIVTSTVYSVRLSGCRYLPEHGALHGGAIVGQGQRRPALPAGARCRQVAEEEVGHPLRQLRLLWEVGPSLSILYINYMYIVSPSVVVKSLRFVTKAQRVPASRSGQSGDDEGRGDDVAEGEAEGHVEAVLGAVRAQQTDVLAAAQAEGVGRSDNGIGDVSGQI